MEQPRVVFGSPNIGVEQIEAAMAKAMAGEKESLQIFFTELLRIPLFVPNRKQTPAPVNLAEYPDSILNVLALSDEDRTIVPVFLQPEYLSEWSERPLEYRQTSILSLLDILPMNWWVCVNPGRDVEKELSPWELQKLLAGSEGIAEIVEELSDDLSSVPLLDLSTGPDSQLKASLSQYAATRDSIAAIYALMKDSESVDAAQELVLVGIQVDGNEQEVAKIKDEATAVAQKSMIGDYPVRVFTGTSLEGYTLSVFKGMGAIYTRNF